jgi:ketosteroid isomerase-like protein
VVEPLSPEVLDQLRIQERFDCWNRDEFELMEELYAEEAVFDPSAVFTDVSPKRGKDEIRRYWHELRDTWAGLRLDPVEVLDLGDGRYVADLRLWGKGSRSGAEVEQRLAMLYAFRPEDQKAVSIRVLPDVATALSEAESSVAPTT